MEEGLYGRQPNATNLGLDDPIVRTWKHIAVRVVSTNITVTIGQFNVDSLVAAGACCRHHPVLLRTWDVAPFVDDIRGIDHIDRRDGSEFSDCEVLESAECGIT